MRISRVISIIVFLFVQIVFGQKNDAKLLAGKVLEQSTSIEGVNIINNATQAAAVSDSDGNFSITVREGDVLVFSAVNLDPVKHRITSEDMTINSLVVKMTAKEVELKEVVVNENANITAENLGIIPYGQKKYRPSSRKPPGRKA